ncbi:Cleavage stimulation factor subunit 1 [Morus notabilis]|uniref:Cleavage stimulation factor 50 kDa subunit n=1 Tax=Morus notabilis TaxID=981085 RepID=W9QD63_9ROSA|nr:Cleavage stimulation factor subunit 1 [Morus notabilis]
MTPFRALYGRDPPKLLRFELGSTANSLLEEQWQARDAILEELRGHLLQAQHSMKRNADLKHCDVSFDVGDLVFLKLSPSFLGQLKKAIGLPIPAQEVPPALAADMELRVEPERLLDTRFSKVTGQLEVLLQWRHLPDYESSWELFDVIQQQFPEFHLEDKVTLLGGGEVDKPLLRQVYNVARCARFSLDGKYIATGSSDTSIKLFEVAKIKQMMLPDARDGPVRTVIWTFYDHALPINDLDFHPQNTILISGAKDHTIKFFDFSKMTAKRAFRVIQDTHNVRSVSFHPSGDFLLAGTDHPIPHLYDVNTFQCYLSASIPEIGVNGAINQAYSIPILVILQMYSTTGGMYVTASKDGAIRLWDGVNASCIRSIVGAHGTSEATSAIFTKDQRFILSCGKDSSVKLWEVGTGRLVKQYLGATHTQLRCQAVFNHTEEFVLCIDEPNNEIVIWDALTAEKVARWPSNHIGAPRWLEHSPVEAAFVSCGTDKSIRYWKEAL